MPRPTRLPIAGDDGFDSHVHCRRRDEDANDPADSGLRVPHSKRDEQGQRFSRDQCESERQQAARWPEYEGDAQRHEQVVGFAEEVSDAGSDETSDGMAQSGIQHECVGIVLILKLSNVTARRQEGERGIDDHAEASEAWFERETRLHGSDRSLEQRIDRHLFLEHERVGR